MSQLQNLQTVASNQIKAHIDGEYSGGWTDRNSMRTWTVTDGVTSEQDAPAVSNIRRRANDAYRNIPMATGAINTLVNSTVGPGLKFQSKINYKFLGITLEKAREIQEKQEFYFDIWANSSLCDYQTTNTFGQLTRLAFHTLLVSGEVFILFPSKKIENSLFSTTMLIIDPIRISTPSLNTNNRIKDGIEYDKSGSPIAYYIKEEPTDEFGVVEKWTKIKTFDKSGRRNIIHSFDAKRPNQKRGISKLAPVLETLKQLQDYTQSELTAAFISSLMPLFITGRQALLDDLPPLPGAESLVPTAERTDASKVKIEAGTIVRLEENESITSPTPGRPNTGYGDFVESIFKQVAIGTDIPFEVLVKLFSSSFSASRGALLEFKKVIDNYLKIVVADIVNPAKEIVISECVARSYIDMPNFFTDLAAKHSYLGSHWGGVYQGQLNPLAETNAILKRAESGLTTLEQETSNLNGGDVYDNIARIGTERNAKIEAGIIKEEETTDEN